MKPFFVRVRFEPLLRISRGRLVTHAATGAEVHAASFLRKRLIVLDSALLDEPRELKRIWIHELYHFVWWRMPPAARASWERLLAREITCRTPGELGWSAESRKQKLTARDRRERTRRWREYCCESFCDSAAWLVSRGRHGEFTLREPHRTARRKWLGERLRYN